MSAAKLPPWGAAHRWEALRRLCRAIAEQVPGCLPASISPEDVDDEEGLRLALFRELPIADGVEHKAAIDREVRRVRGLAEGRLVRANYVRWYAERSDGDAEEFDDREEAVAWLGPDDAPNRLVRITGTSVKRAVR